jgi:hypothetical protein
MKNHHKIFTHLIPKSPVSCFARVCLLSTLIVAPARAAVDYWDPQGTSGANPYLGNQSATWESALWSTSSGGKAVTTAWVEGDAACFSVHAGAGTPAFTVTMNANHSIAGVFDGPLTPDPSTVTISGTGKWLLANAQGFDVTTDGSADPGVVSINVVIADGSYAGTTTGQIVAEGSGTLNLNAANTFSGGSFGLGNGGTLLGYASANWDGIIGIGNSAAFGTGNITLLRGVSGNSGALVANTTGLNVANTLDVSQATVSTQMYLNIVGSAKTSGGTTFSGGITLGANTLNLGLGSTGNQVIETGGISGTGGLSLWNSGILTIKGTATTHTGATTIGAGAGSTPTLELGMANALIHSSSVIMNGGTLLNDGFNQAFSGTLGLTASSTLTFGASSGTALSFAKSAGLTWTGGSVLNISDWQGNDAADGGTSTDTIQIGTDGTGLTSAQLADIELDGNAATLGSVYIDASGFLETPEPSTIALGMLGAGALLLFRRRK